MSPSASSATCSPPRSPRLERRRRSRARSIKYQITIAKLPLAKDIDDFTFEGTPINETLARDLAGGNFLAHQRNVVLVGSSDPAS